MIQNGLEKTIASYDRYCYVGSLPWQAKMTSSPENFENLLISFAFGERQMLNAANKRFFIVLPMERPVNLELD